MHIYRIMVELVDGTKFVAFHWSRHPKDGIRRAHDEAYAEGLEVKRIWAEPKKGA